MSGPFAPITNHTTAQTVQLQISTSTDASKQLELPSGQPIAARNITLGHHQLSMEVKVQGQWQTLSIPIKSPTPSLIGSHIEQAQVSFKHDGTLTIKPEAIQLPVDKPQQLLNLLSYLSKQGQIKGGSSVQNALMQSTSAQGAPVQTLQLKALSTSGQSLSLPELNASVKLDKIAAQLIAQGAQVKAVELTISQGKLQTHLLLNDNARTEITLTPAKLAQLAAKLAPPAQVTHSGPQAMAQVTALTKGNSGPSPLFNINLSRPALALLANQVRPASIHLTNNTQLQLNVAPADIKVITLNTKVSAEAPPIAAQDKAPSLRADVNQPSTAPTLRQSSNTLWQRAQQHLQAWQQSMTARFGGDNTQIKEFTPQAMRLLQSPAKALLTPLLHPTPLRMTSAAAQKMALIQDNGASNSQLRGHSPTPVLSLIDNIPSIVRQRAPLLELTVQMQSLIKSTVKESASPVLAVKMTTLAATSTTIAPSKSDSLPLTSLTPLALTNELTARLQKHIAPAQQLSHSINTLDKLIANAPPELKNLVNQAFSRLISEQIPSTVTSNQVIAQLKPWQVPHILHQSSFVGQLDNLVTALASAPIVTAHPALSPSVAQTALLPLINLLLGQVSSPPAAEQFVQQLQSPSAQALLSELSFIQQSVTPQATQSQASAQQDNNPLVQLFLPMRLPPEVGQTHLSIGRYKQKSNKGETQDVWFVRMQFDYAALGELSVQAHLCKQKLNCELRASSQSLAQLAHQHSEDLRRNLQKHGLGVAPIRIEQVSEQQALQWQSFYKRHSIVNVKV
ncbi:flagellar hook-length control protein FliK [Pseudoalteromonas sp. SSDWG2]|uniref:flagellar hook-length control protein FliK n=1 Tax=Pseudoalteromonas sp. SSDWG2 TaxID=3139391 RepID=UPI003BAB257B